MCTSLPCRCNPFTLPELAVPTSSFALRVDCSVVDVLAPVRIPGFCAGAVGGLPPPPASLPAPPPTSNESIATATADVSLDGESGGEDDDESLLLLVGVVGIGGVGAAVATLWSRNPLAAPSTCVSYAAETGMIE